MSAATLSPETLSPETRSLGTLSPDPRVRGCATLIPPYGGHLVDLRPPREEREELIELADRLPSLQLSDRSTCDLILLATGAFSPLDRFMGREDYRRVLAEMRLTSGHVFPLPLTLPVDPDPGVVGLDRRIALRDAHDEVLAVMRIEEIYEWDPRQEARRAYGTEDPRHPLVAEMQSWGRLNLSGPLQVLRLPTRNDFRELCRTPAQTREALARFGRPNVVAFQTRNPLHRVHEELTKRATAEVDGVLLLHPVVGKTKPGDVDLFTRVRTYRTLTSKYYPRDRVFLTLLPLAMRMAGPREALWHALIRRNYGANHLIVGRDHASPGVNSQGRPFYSPYGAQELVQRFEGELGVRLVPFRELVYLPEEDRYEEVSKIPPHRATLSISGTQVREEYLARGRRLPAWFTRPEVAEILAEAYAEAYGSPAPELQEAVA